MCNSSKLYALHTLYAFRTLDTMKTRFAIDLVALEKGKIKKGHREECNIRFGRVSGNDYN